MTEPDHAPTILPRRFDAADQERFAALSGDCNPMHMSALAARRTQAGAPVVHGVHLLLWLLDVIATANPGLPAFGSLKVRFDQLVYLGDTVQPTISRADAGGVRADLMVGPSVVMRVAIGFEAPGPTPIRMVGPRFAPTEPIELSLAQIEGRSGSVPFATSPDAAAACFPSAARVFGDRTIAALVATTRLVGMVCPGLHSIFGGMTLRAVSAPDADDTLSFRVERCDPRFRAVRMHAVGGSFAGTIESFARLPPVRQKSSEDIAGLLTAGEFAGIRAFVAGGSRGLGEITAKLLALGGATVIVTYASGKDDAEALVSEIAARGADATAMHYDVRKPSAPQLAGLHTVPNQLYFMATPPIFRRKSGLFDPDRFEEFNRVYVGGFWETFSTLVGRDPTLATFYPSSVAVTERPADMTEYAMAKTAGETLCADINTQRAPARVFVERLPRLLTDQTATLHDIATADPIEIMLPVIRAMAAHSGAHRAKAA